MPLNLSLKHETVKTSPLRSWQKWLLKKFGIEITATAVRHRYIQHRYDHIVNKIQQAEGE
ncbi:hypothetical protein CPI31_09305 [Moraxella catarrhalis]|nr:hypothetical protein [Moraxella catarrhalis]